MSSSEIRKGFHHELDDVRAEMITLGAGVVERIPRGTQVLLDGDLEGAEYLIGSDEEFNQRVLLLEERCYRLLALQQPMATDLRAIMAALKMLSEIERSADLVVNICKAARRIYGHDIAARLRGLIAEMSDLAHAEFKFCIEAYAERDSALAAALNDMDDNLDRAHHEFINALFQCHKESAIDLPVAVQLALVARFYERIGDHAVNIGERVQYMITGAVVDNEGVERHLRAADPPADR